MAMLLLVEGSSRSSWTWESIQSAIELPGFSQYFALRRKLESGEPINVLGLGSSVMATYGGCYNMFSRNVTGTLRGYQSTTCDIGSSQWWKNTVFTGWVTRFMNWINEAWPHEHHVFINDGHGGCTFGCYTDSCFSLPHPLDLVILENMAGKSESVDVERLVRHILHESIIRQGFKPAIIIVNSKWAYNKEWYVQQKFWQMSVTLPLPGMHVLSKTGLSVPALHVATSRH